MKDNLSCFLPEDLLSYFDIAKVEELGEVSSKNMIFRIVECNYSTLIISEYSSAKTPLISVAFLYLSMDRESFPFIS